MKTPCQAPEQYGATADDWHADKREDEDDPPLEGEKTWEQRRRRAKQACWDCPLQARMACLELGLAEPLGVWGGYYPEERAAMIAGRAKRARVDA